MTQLHPGSEPFAEPVGGREAGACVCEDQTPAPPGLTAISAGNHPDVYSPPAGAGFELAPEPQADTPHQLATLIAGFAQNLHTYRQTPMVDLIHAACSILLYHTVLRLEDTGQPCLDTLKKHAETLGIIVRILETYPPPQARTPQGGGGTLPPDFHRMIRSIYGVDLDTGCDAAFRRGLTAGGGEEERDERVERSEGRVESEEGVEREEREEGEEIELDIDL